MPDEAFILEIVRMVAPGLIAIGVGTVLIGGGIILRALTGGGLRRRLNDVTERLLELESMVKRNRVEITDNQTRDVQNLHTALDDKIRALEDGKTQDQPQT